MSAHPHAAEGIAVAAPDLLSDPVFALHTGGKLAVASTAPLRDVADLSMAYTPGVARVCTAIAGDESLAARFTWTSRLVAVVTDGTAVLGLGDIGPRAFALANPDPEVHPEVAARHAAVVATGRSDFPNQINNVLAFPGVFAGAFDVRASSITEDMKLSAADALAAVVADELRADRIVPSPFDGRVAPAVAAAVAAQARLDGVATLI